MLVLPSVERNTAGGFIVPDLTTNHPPHLDPGHSPFLTLPLLRQKLCLVILGSYLTMNYRTVAVKDSQV